MTITTVPVDVQVNKEQSSCSPLSVYSAAVEKSGKENVFILESLSGPSRDRKSTIVGIDPLFSIMIYEGYARLEGREELCSFLSVQLANIGFTSSMDGNILLRNKESAWDLLRAIREFFQLPKTIQPSLAYFGYLSYDTIRLVENIETLAVNTTDYPIIALTVFQTLVYFHSGSTVEVLISNSDLWKPHGIADYEALLIPPNDAHSLPTVYPNDSVTQDTVEPKEFLEWVDKALHHIRIGDIYQIQLGHEVQVKTSLPPYEVYRALRKNNPSPYMYLAHIGGVDVIGASPELFVRLKDDIIEMRPIAGTIGKKPGVSSQELILSMTRSEKERAEHLMLVDLCRNDIGRVCQPGSLDVDELMFVEEYSHLYHMVSNVRGIRRPGLDAFDVIKASFPAGTMTGAPKVRAMELIEGLELNRRGIYAGAVGLIGFDDSINTALCIRSTVHKEGTYYLRASAGVVADSEPEKEWEETFYKMSSVYRAVTGKEMMQ
jgi:anthranilate synthase component 1